MYIHMVYLGRISLNSFFHKRVKKSKSCGENLRNRALVQVCERLGIVVVVRVQTQGGRLNAEKAKERHGILEA